MTLCLYFTAAITAVLSVAIQSIIENVNPERRYDIIVLTRDLNSSILRHCQAQLVDNVRWFLRC